MEELHKVTAEAPLLTPNSDIPVIVVSDRRLRETAADPWDSFLEGVEDGTG